MRYRKLSPTGDYLFGRQQGDFWIDQPEAVAQAVATRMRLWRGMWFLDTADGMDWLGSVLGVRTAPIRDISIQTRVLGTQGVTQIVNYNSTTDPQTRHFSAQFSLDTQFGVYSPASPTFSTPSTDPDLPQVGPQPINVNVEVLDETSVNVSWSLYEVP